MKYVRMNKNVVSRRVRTDEGKRRGRSSQSAKIFYMFLHNENHMYCVKAGIKIKLQN